MARSLYLGCSVALLLSWTLCDTAFGLDDAGNGAQARIGDLIFTMPDGWRREDRNNGLTALLAPGLPAGQLYEIRIPPRFPLQGTLRQQLQTVLGDMGKKYKGMEGGQIVEHRHRRGYDVAYTVVSVESNEKAGEYLYWMVYLAQIGDQVQTIFLVTNSNALFRQNQALNQGFLNSVGFASLTVLVNGRPPLTQGTVDQVADFVEWLLEVPMTAEQRQTVQEHLVDAWKRRDKAEMDGAAEILKTRAQLATFNKAQSDLVRQAMQPEAIKQWRQDKDPTAKMVLEIYDAAHRPIASGDPPLTRQATDATIELFYFMACQVSGGGEIQPTAGVKDEWAKKLAAGYSAMNADSKKAIAQMPLAWAAIRYAWPEISAEEKAKLKGQWTESEPVRQLSASLAKIRAEAAASSAQKSADIMRKLQDQHANYMAISNMSSMMHQTNMAIISNFSSGYHYEYRYR